MTDNDLPASKAAMRRAMRQLLASMTPAARATASASAEERLKRQPIWSRTRRLGAFLSRPDELDLTPLLTAFCEGGGRLFLPRFRPTDGAYEFAEVRNLERDLRTGEFGLREPAAECPTLINKQLDLVLVPGLAFDPNGRRLGRGKGFYDRLLPQVNGEFCGVASDWQVLPEVPAGPHDQRLDCLLTPTRWIACGARVV